MLLAASFSIAAVSFAADKKQLEAALAAVDANLKTPAGKQYDELIGKEFPDKFLASFRQCKQSMPADTKYDAFDMFLRLKLDGKIEQVLVYPETQFGNCAGRALLAGKFSSPPHSDYWVNIHMQAQR